jgi:hypothetical protein
MLIFRSSFLIAIQLVATGFLHAQKKYNVVFIAVDGKKQYSAAIRDPMTK